MVRSRPTDLTRRTWPALRSNDRTITVGAGLPYRLPLGRRRPVPDRPPNAGLRPEKHRTCKPSYAPPRPARVPLCTPVRQRGLSPRPGRRRAKPSGWQRSHRASGTPSRGTRPRSSRSTAAVFVPATSARPGRLRRQSLAGGVSCLIDHPSCGCHPLTGCLIQLWSGGTRMSRR
jgi:hypothetical protein